MIGVTGASGGVGSRVVRHLEALAGTSEVVPLARRPEAVSGGACFADYDDPASLRQAFAGLRTLVFVSSDGVADMMRRHHRNVIAAAVAANVPHVVYTSIIDIAPGSRFYFTPVHRETERLLAESGLSYCLARTSIFADFFAATWLAPAGTSGLLALPAGAARMSLVSRDDVARALAAAALSGSQGILELTGPEAITAEEIARLAGLRYQALDDDAYRRQLADDQSPAWLIEAFSSMFASVREGRFATVSKDIAKLTGEPSQTFAEFLRQAR